MYYIMCRNSIGQVYEMCGPLTFNVANNLMRSVGTRCVQKRIYCQLWLTQVLDI